MANRNSENVNKQIADIVADEMNKSVINIKTFTATLKSFLQR